MSELSIRELIEGYVKFVGAGDVDALMELFAEGAVMEDPVGSPQRATLDDIRAFYAAGAKLSMETELTGPICIAGDQAAFPFRLTVLSDDGGYYMDVIDVFQFNAESKIASMKAYFGEGNRHSLSR